MDSAAAPAREPLVALWLALIAALVALMILVGGATRLTDSGLSITEWRPISGALPPLNAADWEREFALYRETTEYQVQNRGMTLAEFEEIYWWEWGHRFLGRLIGVAFAIPFFVFWITGRLRGRLWPVFGLFALGALQGAIGWWMVASGLVGRLDVAPLRLAVHLGMAFLIFAIAIRLMLGALGRRGLDGETGAPRWALWAFAALLFTQIILGAFVAGNDAGRAYTDWPTIGGEWWPSTYAALTPFHLNFLENHAAVQFNHRLGGYLVALCGLALAGAAMARGRGPARLGALALGAGVLAQIGLGVAVILNAAPLDLSLAHQGLAILLFGLAAALPPLR